METASSWLCAYFRLCSENTSGILLEASCTSDFDINRLLGYRDTVPDLHRIRGNFTANSEELLQFQLRCFEKLPTPFKLPRNFTQNISSSYGISDIPSTLQRTASNSLVLSAERRKQEPACLFTAGKQIARDELTGSKTHLCLSRGVIVRRGRATSAGNSYFYRLLVIDDTPVRGGQRDSTRRVSGDPFRSARAIVFARRTLWPDKLSADCHSHSSRTLQRDFLSEKYTPQGRRFTSAAVSAASPSRAPSLAKSSKISMAGVSGDREDRGQSPSRAVLLPFLLGGSNFPGVFEEIVHDRTRGACFDGFARWSYQIAVPRDLAGLCGSTDDRNVVIIPRESRVTR